MNAWVNTHLRFQVPAGCSEPRSHLRLVKLCETGTGIGIKPDQSLCHDDWLAMRWYHHVWFLSGRSHTRTRSETSGALPASLDQSHRIPWSLPPTTRRCTRSLIDVSRFGTASTRVVPTFLALARLSHRASQGKLSSNIIELWGCQWIELMMVGWGVPRLY